MFSPPSFVIDWATLLDQIILAGERLYLQFMALGYWFTAPISMSLGNPLSPFYMELFGPFIGAITSLEHIANLASDGFYGDFISGLIGADTITGISMLSIIGVNIVLFIVARFIKWIWDVLPFF